MDFSFLLPEGHLGRQRSALWLPPADRELPAAFP